MAEAGIDISTHRPKGLVEAVGPDVALVVGLCAEEACPVVPGARSEHWPLPDPAGTRDPDFYGQIRDQLRRRIEDLVTRLPGGQ